MYFNWTSLGGIIFNDMRNAISKKLLCWCQVQILVIWSPENRLDVWLLLNGMESQNWQEAMLPAIMKIDNSWKDAIEIFLPGFGQLARHFGEAIVFLHSWVGFPWSIFLYTVGYIILQQQNNSYTEEDISHARCFIGFNESLLTMLN